MSLTSLLLAFAPGIAARFRAPIELVDRAELEEAKRELAELKTAYDKVCDDAAMWRGRALAAPQPAGPDFRPPELARLQNMQWAAAQLAQAQQNDYAAQQNAQMAQQAQLAAWADEINYQMPGLGQNLLGAQTLGVADWVCNCVPARHDMFLRG